jgi:hypothetical protein
MIHRSGEAVLHFLSLGTAKRIAANPGKFTRVQIVSSLAPLSSGGEHRGIYEGTLAARGRRTLHKLGHNLSGEEVEGEAGLVGGQHRSQRNRPGYRGHNIASRKIRAALAAAVTPISNSSPSSFQSPEWQRRPERPECLAPERFAGIGNPASRNATITATRTAQHAGPSRNPVTGLRTIQVNNIDRENDRNSEIVLASHNCPSRG